MLILRQSTAVEVPIGPLLDSTDGNTAESGLTITQPDIRLKKNGGAWAQKSAAQTLSHEENGWYEVSLSATDTDTVGHLIVAVHESGALPVWREFQVVEEAVYDALFAAGAVGPLLANSTGSGLTAIPWNAAWDAEVQSECADALNAYDPPTNAEMVARTLAAADYATASALATVDGNVDSILADTGTDGVVVASIANNAITAAAIATGAIDADAIADNAIDAGAIASNAITDTKIASGAFTAEKFAAGAFDAVWSVTTRTLSSISALAAEIRAALGLDSANLDTQLGTIDSNVDAVLEDTGTTLPATLATVAGYIDTEVSAIKAVTDNLPDSGALSSLATASALATVDTVVDAIKATTDKLDTALELDGAVYRYTTNALENAPSGGGGGTSDWTSGEKEQIRHRLGIDGDAASPSATPSLATAAALSAVDGKIDTIDGNVDAILVDTSTTLQAELDGIQAATEDIQSRLPAALVSGRIDASVGGMQANTVTAAALASDAVTEIQSGLATASALTTVDTVVDSIKAVTDALPDALATVDGNVDAILEDTGTTIPGLIAGLPGDILDLANGVETSITPRQALRLILAAAAGKISGAGTTTITIRNVGDTKTRITATTDSAGNRSAVTTDVT